MNQRLPIAWKGFSTLYLEPGLRLSILKASGEYEEWMQMNFINLYASEYQTGGLIYKDGYLKLFYESTRPAVLRSFFRERAWRKEFCGHAAEALACELADGGYVLLDLDEYHVPGTYYAGRVHYWRRFLIWGVEENSFLASSHDRFARLASFRIPRAVLETAAGVRGEKIPNASPEPGVTLWLKRGLFRRIAYEPYAVYRQLAQYQHANNVQHTVHADGAKTVDSFGFAFYDRWIDRLALGVDNLEKVDYRALGMLAEQKEGLAGRLEYLSLRLPCRLLESSAREYRAMAAEARRLLGLMLRFASAGQETHRQVWGDLVNSIRRIQLRDRAVTRKLVCSLE
mgnify:CR=1 FL=1